LDTDTQTGAVASSSLEELEICEVPIGVASLVEPTNAVLDILHGAGLGNPLPVVKLLMQRSGCFQVVDRGAAQDAIMRERELSQRGELRDSIAYGQMVTADFVITPAILFQDSDAGGGGFGAILGAVAKRIIPLAGAVTSQTLEAQTMLTATSVKTGVNVAIAEGSARKKDIDFVLFSGLIGSSVGALGVGGSYMDTDIGRVVMAAFADAHNNLVRQLRVP
jgi:curli biogenesis system outer membrane secretion channel CsgG